MDENATGSDVEGEMMDGRHESLKAPRGRSWRGARVGMRWTRGLRAQMLLWTILPLTLVLIGVAFTGVYSHDQSMRVLVRERDQALADVAAQAIAGDLEKRVGTLSALAGGQDVLKDEARAMEGALSGAGKAGEIFAAIAALGDTGGALAYAGDPGVEWVFALPQMTSLSQAVLASHEPRAMALHDAGETEWLLLIAVPSEQMPAGGIVIGVARPAILDVRSRLAGIPLGQSGAAYLLDGSQRILASYPAGSTSMDFIVSDAAGMEQQVNSATSIVTAGIDTAHVGWRILVARPWREVIGPVLHYSQFVPLVAALGVIVSLLTLYHGYRSIVRPLQTLGRQAERIAWGDFSAAQEPAGGVREIEDLQAALQDMAGRIQSYQAGMHDYIAALTQGQEEERRRIARELHDGTAQALIALRQQLELAQRDLQADPVKAIERIAEIRQMLVGTLDEIRRFSRDLRPLYLDDLGFVPAVKMLVGEKSQPGGVAIRLVEAGPARRLPADLELSAYRIVQESLNNVLQHANATTAEALVEFGTTALTLQVTDDGQGFAMPDSPATWARAGHFGLMGIQERAQLHGGQMAVRSAPGAGTRIRVTLPYRDRG